MTKKKSKKIRDERQVYHDLTEVVNNTYLTLLDKIIFKIRDFYVIYNQYVIVHDKSEDRYVVGRKRDDFQIRFNSKKMALLWSIMDFNRYLYEAERIKLLDNLVASLTVEEQIHNRMLKHNIVVYSNKIQTDRERNKKYTHEINKYIQLANKLQKRNSKNEIN